MASQYKRKYGHVYTRRNRKIGKPSKGRCDEESATFSIGESRIPKLQKRIHALGYSEIDVSNRRSFAHGDLSREYRKPGSRLAITIGAKRDNSTSIQVRVDDLGFESD